MVLVAYGNFFKVQEHFDGVVEVDMIFQILSFIWRVGIHLINWEILASGGGMCQGESELMHKISKHLHIFCKPALALGIDVCERNGAEKNRSAEYS